MWDVASHCLFSSFRSILHLLDVDLEASDQANVVHSIKMQHLYTPSDYIEFAFLFHY